MAYTLTDADRKLAAQSGVSESDLTAELGRNPGVNVDAAIGSVLSRPKAIAPTQAPAPVQEEIPGVGIVTRQPKTLTQPLSAQVDENIDGLLARTGVAPTPEVPASVLGPKVLDPASLRFYTEDQIYRAKDGSIFLRKGVPSPDQIGTQVRTTAELTNYTEDQLVRMPDGRIFLKAGVKPGTQEKAPAPEKPAPPTEGKPKATLINPDTGDRVAVEVGSAEAQRLFGRGYVLEGQEIGRPAEDVKAPQYGSDEEFGTDRKGETIKVINDAMAALTEYEKRLLDLSDPSPEEKQALEDLQRAKETLRKFDIESLQAEEAFVGQGRGATEAFVARNQAQERRTRALERLSMATDVLGLSERATALTGQRLDEKQTAAAIADLQMKRVDLTLGLHKELAAMDTADQEKARNFILDLISFTDGSTWDELDEPTQKAITEAVAQSPLTLDMVKKAMSRGATVWKQQQEDAALNRRKTQAEIAKLDREAMGGAGGVSPLAAQVILNPSAFSSLTPSAQTDVLENLAANGIDVGPIVTQYGGLSETQLKMVEPIIQQFNSDPQVREFEDVQNKKYVVDQIMSRGSTSGPADMALVYQFMKAMDPNSVVRESEYANAAQSGNIFAGVWAKFNGMLNPKGGILPENVRREFQSLINTEFLVRKESYVNKRNQFGTRIDRITHRENGRDFLVNHLLEPDEQFRPDDPRNKKLEQLIIDAGGDPAELQGLVDDYGYDTLEGILQGKGSAVPGLNRDLTKISFSGNGPIEAEVPFTGNALEARKLAMAIRKQESGGDYTIPGKSGEYGAYQYMPGTWSAAVAKYLPAYKTVPIDKVDPWVQDYVTVRRIQDMLNAGRTPYEVALIWNGGDTTVKAGVNQKGIAYDTGAYATNVMSIYDELFGG